MKIYYIILIIILQSCGTTVHEMHIKCKLKPEELFNLILPYFEKEGFKIIEHDLRNGYLHAVSNPSYDFGTGFDSEADYGRGGSVNTTGTSIKHWDIKYYGDLIIATAFEEHSTTFHSKNSGSTEEIIYYYDNKFKFSYSSSSWYWDMRNMVEGFCVSNIEWVEYKVKNKY